MPNWMRMVATNGHRLAKMEVPLQGGTAQPAELIVPPKALEQFRKLFGADDEIVIDTDLAKFVDDDREFVAMVLGEDAVEQRRALPVQEGFQHRPIVPGQRSVDGFDGWCGPGC